MMKDFHDSFGRPLASGSRIRYCHEIRGATGTIVEIGRTPHGGDCRVKWDYTGCTSEECGFNLVVVGD